MEGSRFLQPVEGSYIGWGHVARLTLITGSFESRDHLLHAHKEASATTTGLIV